MNIFNFIFYQPIYNLLFFLYKYLPGHDLGIAIILLTVIIRFILHPLSNYSLKNQKVLSKLQPKILEIQKKYKDDKEKQTKAQMELYQKEKVNPFSGCLPLLLQLPILIALYQVFLKGLDPKIFNFISLGIVDLSKPNLFLALATGVLQFFQTKISMVVSKETTKETVKGTNSFTKVFQNQMLYFFPVLAVYIVYKFGSIIGFYWIVSSLFSIWEQHKINKVYAR